MDYKEKHKEDLESAKGWLAIAKENNNKIAIQILENLFPELRESEDERIREMILELVSISGNGNQWEEINNWLKKQGEQKLADKVEPKFKVGDWITNGEYTWNVTDIKPLDYILQSPNGDVVDDTISYVDEHFHLWTIQDAKDGDVLFFKDHGNHVIGIIKPIERRNTVDAYCLFENLCFKKGMFYNLDTEDPHPATNEQRNLLFQKIKESGYEWDEKKKELKELPEQNETNKLEKEIDSYIKTSLAIKFPTTDPKMIESDIRYIAHYFYNWTKNNTTP